MGGSQQPIKILVVVDSMGLGGAQSVIIDFCAGYDRECLDVLVCSLGKRVDMAPRLDNCSVRYKALKFAKWNPFCVDTLRRLAAEFEPDIIYLHLVKSLLAGSRVARKLDIPFVYHEHSDGTIRTVKDIAAWGPIAGALYRFKQRFASRANGIIAAGPKAADSMLAVGFGRPDQMRLVPIGIDLTRFEFSDEDRDEARRSVREEFDLPPDAVIICNVGRFRSEKNWPDFFEVVGGAVNGFPDTRVLAVGSGSLLDPTKALCRELGLKDQTVFTGFRDDVPRLFLASDVMAYTSVRDSGPVVVQEAMACGVPVVTYDVGETRAMVRENLDGHVVDNGDTVALTERLGALLADPDKRAACSASCRQRAASEFDVRLMVRRMELVLSNARIRHARPRVLGH